MKELNIFMSPEELQASVWKLSQRVAIEELQADYWWYMDTKQWEKWKDVFTDDFTYYQYGQLVTQGRDAFVAYNQKQLPPFVTAHQGHQHKIIFTSDTTATGRWILNDYLTTVQTKEAYIGYGYYLNDYEKCADGKWRIKVQRLGYFRFETPQGPNLFEQLAYQTPASE